MILQELLSKRDKNKEKTFARFFKTGQGEYGEGDVFLGISVPETRKISYRYKDLSLEELEKFLSNKYHECRLAALMILVYQYNKGDYKIKQKIFNFYLRHTKYINNWDLVDLSVYKIVGDYLVDKDRSILYKLAKSKNIWERRIAIVSTYAFIKNKENKDTFELTKLLIEDNHDLIHKACGWMLRESGKSVSEAELMNFLEKYGHKMPRTMLRYAIEKFSEPKRMYFLRK
ncbi:MAG: DNA alkylation repair protein [Candidatus Moranbacteria bacterium]|nr:DNA alkylation repair protein [Candidatus Moranbacteria bacterium]